jgi:YihY family inner membrane protein
MAAGTWSERAGERFGRIRRSVSRADIEPLATDVVETFREHHLLIAAYGIAFRVLVATVTGTLCLLGLLGFLDLSEVWRSDVAPDVHASVSDASFRVIDQAVPHVLTEKAFYWVRIGAVLAIWQISSLVRTCGQTLNAIYGTDEERPLREWVGASIAVAVAIALLLLATLAVVRLGPLAIDAAFGDSTPIVVAGFVIRWMIAAALLLVAVGLVVRYGPSIDRPLHWVTLGSALTVGGWIAVSIAFGVYLTAFASFGSVYGVLLSSFIGVEYIYVCAVVFLGGLTIDRLLQKDA